jgi:hypothetical protein
MKQIFLLAALAYSYQSFAHIEYRPGDEEVPTAARTSVAKQCFSEAVSSGCHHPREGREEFRTCIKDQVGSLSSTCQAFMTRLYGKGN